MQINITIDVITCQSTFICYPWVLKLLKTGYRNFATKLLRNYYAVATSQPSHKILSIQFTFCLNRRQSVSNRLVFLTDVTDAPINSSSFSLIFLSLKDPTKFSGPNPKPQFLSSNKGYLFLWSIRGPSINRLVGKIAWVVSGRDCQHLSTSVSWRRARADPKWCLMRSAWGMQGDGRDVRGRDC